MEIISNGIIPAGMEIMDKVLLEATNNFSKARLPLEAEAMLIAELDGTKSEVEELIKKVAEICKKINAQVLKSVNQIMKEQSFGLEEKSCFSCLWRNGTRLLLC